MSPPDHPAVTIVALGLVTLPLLLLTAGVLVLVVVSICSSTDARRKHSRRVIRDLSDYARAIRGSK